MAPAPAAQHQFEHRWALALAGRVIAEARRRGERVSLAIVDERGDPIQQDRMDRAPTASVQLAEALAATAATFQIASAAVAERYPDPGARAELARALPFAILAAPGGQPLLDGGVVVAGLGVAGPPPPVCEQIVQAVLEPGEP